MAKAPADQLFTAEWFPYYFERFERSGRVATLSLAEEGAYHRAIRFAWKYGSVPSDPDELAAVIQKRCTRAIALKVLRHFEVMPGVPSQAVHPTVEEIREEQYQKFLSRSERGLAGAEKRWGKKEVPPSKPPQKPPKNGSAIAVPMPYLDKRYETKDSDSDSFSETDRCVHACVSGFPDIDPRLVEIAVLETMIRRNGSQNEHKPIKSPERYFAAEIEQMAVNAKKLGTRAIDAMLARRREQTGVLVEEV